ncbi:putative structural protein [Shahe hepe-like virus 1]|uniref:putative structural protein n=1 Tax=Shahe hepe-like virus 1 TaxID=1923415 RepID=UPI00090B8ECE|nr:putative structural protein [Shahe hepe-like virus 1]APG77712.1 putative structural protein [Shahe hepe-like virus 1]
MNSDPAQANSVSEGAPVELSTGSTGLPSSDFTDSKPLFLEAGTQHTAVHCFRVAKDLVTLAEGSKPGEICFVQPLTPFGIDNTATNLASDYEYYSFKNVEIAIEAVSPFGTSSGGMQVAWITDPENVTLPQGDDGQKLTSLAKVIRQDGSVLVRPRNSALFNISTEGARYCLPGTESRLSSFGSLVALVRSPPGTGDVADFAATITGEIHFMRSTRNAPVYIGEFPIGTFTIDETQPLIEENDLILPVRLSSNDVQTDISRWDFRTPLKLTLRGKDGRFTKIHEIKADFATFKLTNIDDQYAEGILMIDLPFYGLTNPVVRINSFPRQIINSYEVLRN